jgi:hypothetical protein
MTPVDLLEQFKAFTESALKDLIMPVKTPPTKEAEYRAPEVFKMNLPDVKADKDKAPYVVLQFINGDDSQNAGEEQESVCNVRVVVCAWSQDSSEGPMLVLNMLTRLRTALLEKRVIANRYALRLPLEYLVYPDNPVPFFFGEMMTVWEMPTITRREIL